jgi:biotin-independent malonate decarboxylase beta subunit
MSVPTVNDPGLPGVRSLPAPSRIAALADGGAVTPLGAPRPSPHLFRFGVAAQDDDGLATARVRIAGAPVLIAAQDERFLRGSVGANHGDALRGLFELACDERPVAVVLLQASGGVRLHEANAAELALARALRALFDARLAGVPVLALAAGDVFGGASVLACAADRLGMLPGTRIGLSGPKVVESVHGRWELDADCTDDVNAVFGADARAAGGSVDLVVDDVDAIRAWVRMSARNTLAFDEHVWKLHAALAARILPPWRVADDAPPLSEFPAMRRDDAAGWLWRGSNALATRTPRDGAFGVSFAHGLDSALLARLADWPAEVKTLVVVENSRGHEVSRRAEMQFISRFLAHHAAVLSLVRARGHRVVGLLAGTGHSAAFFVNALQATELYALPAARVVAMEPSAIERVTGLRVAAMIEDDPLLGQPVRHLAALGGITAIVDLRTLPSLFERS